MVVVEGRVETRLARKEIPGPSQYSSVYLVPLHGSTHSSDPRNDDLAANSQVPDLGSPKIREKFTTS